MNKEAMDRAWHYLDIAIIEESKGMMAKARMSLALACKYELEALGFVSITAKDILQTIQPWTVPATLIERVQAAA